MAGTIAQLVIVLFVSLTTQAALVPPVNINSKTENSAEEIGSPLRMAQCRARCLQRFSGGSDREASCLQGPDCFMCWENCALLQNNYPVWGAMCAEKRICFPGCQQACRFHHEGLTQQAEPVILTRGEEVLSVAPLTSGGGVARWRPSPAPRQQHVVYVLMARPAGAASWRQISQSVECEVRLEAGSTVMSPGTTVRVLVVDPEGLVTIYSPASSEVTTSATPVASVVHQQVTKTPLLISSLTTPSNSQVDEDDDDFVSDVWRLEEVSLLHQRVLVIAEVAWPPRAKRGVYLVTWELDGGGLRGNLFTDSTSVTLSLWPDTVYHIQVELVSRGSGHKKTGVERSEPLIIDTRKAPQVVESPASPAHVSDPWGLLQRGGAANRQRRHFTQEMLAGTGAAMLLFLIIAAAMAWRCHRARSLGTDKRRLLLADDSISAGISQPPIVSVMSTKDCLNCPRAPGLAAPVLEQSTWETDVPGSPSFLRETDQATRHELRV